MIWILVAHRADARLFRCGGRESDEIELIRNFDYPEGRRQNREIDTDAKGSRYSTLGGFGPGSQMKHGLDPQMEAAEHLTDIFAKELAEALRDGRTHQQYDEAIVIAEPGFLGKVRKFLDKQTGKTVSSTINRNMSGIPLPQLQKELREVIRSTRRVA